VVHAQVTSKWYFRWLLKYVPHLAVDSASPLAMKLICRLVETGTPVVIFPEGRLTITGSLMKVYDGAAFVAAKTGATVVPVRIEGSGRSYFGRLAGIYPLRLFPKIRIMIQPRRQIPMPQLPSAKLRRRRAGEMMRRILLDMLVATRPRRTFFQAFLDAKATFGAGYKLVEDVRLHEESYGSLMRIDRYPAWTEPLLQEFFVGACIILAPFAGPFADALAKGRVMLCGTSAALSV
jgi:acyl-[acyl-carrier-protein]-phospholipid O-acyltransferase / long-chain-fatty-acid--[acyl-carrier-protein] ligase